MVRKYAVATLGCKVNQYESQQIRALLESYGLREAAGSQVAQFAVVNTCAVTGNASRRSRRLIRRMSGGGRTPVVVVGCGATADADAIRSLTGVVAVLGHETDTLERLRILLDRWLGVTPVARPARAASPVGVTPGPNVIRYDESIKPAESQPGRDASTSRTVHLSTHIIPPAPPDVKQPFDSRRVDDVIGPATAREKEAPAERWARWSGSTSRRPRRAAAPPRRPSVTNPQSTIDDRRSTIPNSQSALVARIECFAGHQRAFLKVQDGCDAFCSYCIIPRLRGRPRSKPIAVAVAEAADLVRAGHREIILTGIFLGAYGHATALRKRWGRARRPLADLVDAIARVEGLARLRLSSLEPGDVDSSLLDVLSGHDTCVPHLHLPLQSGSPRILSRMNRQYTSDAFLDMIERVKAALDRPAISTDILVGFPGESEEDFNATLAVARQAGFCKIHAFPFSPRQQTAAARWTREFVAPSLVRERMGRLADLERELSLDFRRRFVGQTERVIVENGASQNGTADNDARQNDLGMPRGLIHHGRADRYFSVHFSAEDARPDDVRPGDVVAVHIDRVTPTRTHATRVMPTVRIDRSAAERAAI